jgi:hypothetical protein
MIDYFILLGIERGASLSEIKESFDWLTAFFQPHKHDDQEHRYWATSNQLLLERAYKVVSGITGHFTMRQNNIVVAPEKEHISASNRVQHPIPQNNEYSGFLVRSPRYEQPIPRDNISSYELMTPDRTSNRTSTITITGYPAVAGRRVHENLTMSEIRELSPDYQLEYVYRTYIHQEQRRWNRRGWKESDIYELMKAVIIHRLGGKWKEVENRMHGWTHIAINDKWKNIRKQIARAGIEDIWT